MTERMSLENRQRIRASAEAVIRCAERAGEDEAEQATILRLLDEFEAVEAEAAAMRRCLQAWAVWCRTDGEALAERDAATELMADDWGDAGREMLAERDRLLVMIAYLQSDNAYVTGASYIRALGLSTDDPELWAKEHRMVTDAIKRGCALLEKGPADG